MVYLSRLPAERQRAVGGARACTRMREGHHTAYGRPKEVPPRVQAPPTLPPCTCRPRGPAACGAPHPSPGRGACLAGVGGAARAARPPCGCVGAAGGAAGRAGAAASLRCPSFWCTRSPHRSRAGARRGRGAWGPRRGRGSCATGARAAGVEVGAHPLEHGKRAAAAADAAAAAAADAAATAAAATAAAAALLLLLLLLLPKATKLPAPMGSAPSPPPPACSGGRGRSPPGPGLQGGTAQCQFGGSSQLPPSCRLPLPITATAMQARCTPLLTHPFTHPPTHPWCQAGTPRSAASQ